MSAVPSKGLPGNVKLVSNLVEEDWEFLSSGMTKFLEAIGRPNYTMSCSSNGHGIRSSRKAMRTETKSAAQFPACLPRPALVSGRTLWHVLVDRGDVVPLVPIGSYRPIRRSGTMPSLPRRAEYACPSGIPTQDRINLLRKGKIREALDLVLHYNPFPGSVCGQPAPTPV